MKPRISFQNMAVVRQRGRQNGYGSTPKSAYADFQRRAERSKLADPKLIARSIAAQYLEWHDAEVDRAVSAAVAEWKIAAQEKTRKADELQRNWDSMTMVLWIQSAIAHLGCKNQAEAMMELERRGISLAGSKHDAKVFLDRHMYEFRKAVPPVPANRMEMHVK